MFALGQSVYAYVDNNPLRWIDPTGLGKWDKFYGWPKEFWNWLHREDGGRLIKELKDPATKQVPKDVAEPYYQEWLEKNKGDDLLGLLVPWQITPSDIGVPPCEMPGGPSCGPIYDFKKKPEDCGKK